MKSREIQREFELQRVLKFVHNVKEVTLKCSVFNAFHLLQAVDVLATHFYFFELKYLAN